MWHISDVYCYYLTFLMKPQGAHLPRYLNKFFFWGGQWHSLWELRFLLTLPALEEQNLNHWVAK